MNRVLLVVGILCAQTVFAQGGINPCAVRGQATIAPGQPGPNDSIQYTTVLPNFQLFQSDPSFFVYSKETITPSNPSSIAVELIVAEGGLNIPGYNSRPVQYTTWLGSLAPLVPGAYSLSIGFNTYDPALGIQTICAPGDPKSFLVAQTPGATETAPVVEFYNASLDHYFVTQYAAEIAILDAGNSWKRTGQSFLAYKPGNSDGRGQPVWRYYGLPSAGLDSHFYTWNWYETTRVPTVHLGGGWVFETNNAFTIEVPEWPSGQCAVGTVPVFRLWNGRKDSAHRYTADVVTKQAMIAKGYVAEGYGLDTVYMCSPQH